MIGQDAVCHVNTICIFWTNFSCVWPGTCALRIKTIQAIAGNTKHNFFLILHPYLLNGLEIRDEKVSVVVRHLVLEYRHQTLQSHACVNALLRQRL